MMGEAGPPSMTDLPSPPTSKPATYDTSPGQAMRDEFLKRLVEGLSASPAFASILMPKMLPTPPTPSTPITMSDPNLPLSASESPADGSAAPSPTAAEAALRLLSAMTNSNDGASSRTVSTDQPLGALHMETDGSSNLAAALAAAVASSTTRSSASGFDTPFFAAMERSFKESSPSVSVPDIHQMRETRPNSPHSHSGSICEPSPLPKSNDDTISRQIDEARQRQEYELEESLLRRLEREYMEDKRQVFSFETKWQLAQTDSERLQRQVDELEQQLQLKRESFEKVNKDRQEYESMWRFLSRRLDDKKDMIKEKQAKLDLLRSSLSSRLDQNLDPLLVGMTRSEDRGDHDLGFDLTRRLMEERGFSSSSDLNVLLKRSRDNSLEDRSRSSASIASTPSEHGTSRDVCFNFNRTSCRRNDCPRQHICIICSGQHPILSCQKERNICVKWNMESCTGTCHREHRCLRCASKEHRLLDCPIPHMIGGEFCFAWNSSNASCKLAACHRQHRCMRCKGPHPVLICPENSEIYFEEQRIRLALHDRLGTHEDAMEVETRNSKRVRREPDPIDAPLVKPGSRRLTDQERRTVCRDWNNGRCDDARDKCKFRHVCIRCGSSEHRERRCILPNSD
ncbi:hypothetical protein HK102_003439 [Quaeritorhiza haematococci]|nr:hypothetical protein HK102_003439 [Quaeritorhiza haematococci]